MKNYTTTLATFSKQLLAIALMTVSFGAMAEHHGEAKEIIGDLKDVSTEAQSSDTVSAVVDATVEEAKEMADKEMADKEGIDSEAVEAASTLAE